MNARCIGCSSSPSASPSIVVISCPSPAIASVRQASTRRPSTHTVQAPHVPWSQPFLRAGEIEVLAQRVQQADARLEFDGVLSAVDLERHRDARWADDGETGLDKCHGTASFMAGWFDSESAAERAFASVGMPGDPGFPPGTGPQTDDLPGSAPDRLGRITARPRAVRGPVRRRTTKARSGSPRRLSAPAGGRSGSARSATSIGSICSMLIEASVTLDVDPAADVSDVVLTIGHDQLSHGVNDVRYNAMGTYSPGTEPSIFVAAEPTSTRLPATGVTYYSIAQAEIAGFVLAVHTQPRSPERLTGFDIVVREPDTCIMSLPGMSSRARAAVHNWRSKRTNCSTAGGFYRRLSDYDALMRDALAAKAQQEAALDYSISYDYGAEINAFAKRFAVCSATPTLLQAKELAPELQADFDRYTGHYLDLFVAGHYQKQKHDDVATARVCDPWHRHDVSGNRRRNSTAIG